MITISRALYTSSIITSIKNRQSVPKKRLLFITLIKNRQSVLKMSCQLPGSRFILLNVSQAAAWRSRLIGSLGLPKGLLSFACHYKRLKTVLKTAFSNCTYSCSVDDVYTSLCVVIGVIVVVKMEGPSYVCKTDEVGEICVSSEATGSQYWGLAGLTNSAFKVQALLADGKPLSDALYTRSGLLGFLGPVSNA